MKILSTNNSLNFGALKLNSSVAEQLYTDKNKNPLGHMADIETLTTLKKMAAENDSFDVKVARAEKGGNNPCDSVAVTIQERTSDEEGKNPVIRGFRLIGKDRCDQDWTMSIYNSIKEADRLRAEQEGTPVTDWKAVEAEIIKGKVLKLDIES